MSEQYPGGFVTKTPPTPAGPYENSSGYGIWNLSQQAAYKAQGLWPTAGAQAPDAQFNYVTMLLHGDGTNGAQNNTFLDSSTNNFTITRNGNTTQGSFSPYGSNWSNYFNASATSYLSIPSSSAFAFGTGDFTVEFWVNYASASTGYVLYDGRGTTLSQTGFTIYTTSGTLYAQQGVSAIVTATAPTANTWHHIAFSRSGSSNKLFVDGVQVGSTATDSTNYATGYSVGIGAPLDPGYTAAYALSGYMSNVRVVKGTAVYTSNFTPSTTPLTAISGTSLLICQSNRFVDNSSNAFTLTVGGNPSVQRFNPFGTSTAYSTATIGGSGYFNGYYLDSPSSSSLSFTGDFCVEGWIYQTSRGNGGSVFELNLYTDGILFRLGVAPSYDNLYINGTDRVAPSQYFPLNQWNHYAITRSGTTARLFSNGVVVWSGTVSGTVNSASGKVRYGELQHSAGQQFYGYMSDSRIVNGSAVYTSNFTPNTAPLTAITNTQLLLSMTNAAIYDNAMMNDFATEGNAQISTSVVKYGTGSLSFDGNTGAGTGLRAPANPSMNFGNGAFTIEAWVNFNNANDYFIIAARLDSGGSGDWSFFYNYGIDKWRIVGGSGASIIIDMSNTWVPTTGTWYHVAVCRSGNNFYFFIDGVQQGTTQTSSATFPYTTAYSTTVGKFQNDDNSTNGYIDDLRITKGYARYTTTFTPPTAAFPNTGPT